jgi:hypothetical protein
MMMNHIKRDQVYMRGGVAHVLVAALYLLLSAVCVCIGLKPLKEGIAMQEST